MICRQLYNQPFMEKKSYEYPKGKKILNATSKVGQTNLLEELQIKEWQIT